MFIYVRNISFSFLNEYPYSSYRPPKALWTSIWNLKTCSKVQIFFMEYMPKRNPYKGESMEEEDRT